MEQVFDLREFMIGFWKKGRVIILFAVAFAILGAGFGWYRFPNDDQIMSSSTATVGTVDETQDATALSSAMTMVNAYITSDTFYTELLNEISATMETAKVEKLFNGDLTPKIDAVKEIIKIQTKGNIIIAEVIASNDVIPVETSELCINYITANVTKYNSNTVASKLGNEVVNITKQNNDTLLKDVVLFGLIGLVGGVGVSVLFVFFIGVFSVKVKSADDLKKFKLPVLSDNADRAVAVINALLNGEDKHFIALTSTVNADVMQEAKVMEQAFLRTGKAYSIIDTRGKQTMSIDEATTLFEGFDKPLLVCCDNIITSTDAMYNIASSNYVILCEQKKVSHTDIIENALEQVSSIKTKTIGFILK